MNPPRSIIIFTRRNAASTADVLARVAELAHEHDIELRIPPEEVAKHGLGEMPGAVLGADPDEPVDLAITLGGDGTILSTLRRYAGTAIPVLAVNFGQIGFLATIERDNLEEGLRRAFSGELESLQLPALTITTSSGEHLAVNDISFHRRQDLRVAELGYSVRGESLGAVRCDGLVAATPAGSTGYNLANGGPVLAWGVSGYVVSFIAPHTLTARALVVAPDDVLEVVNSSDEEPVDVTTDGRAVCALEPQQRMEIRYREDMVSLVQRPGANFYHRLREKFGRLSF